MQNTLVQLSKMGWKGEMGDSETSQEVVRMMW